MKPKSQVETPVSGYTHSFAARLDLVLKRYPSLQDAAEAAGVHKNQFSKWRRGETKPALYSVSELCKGVGVSLDWLMSDASDPALPGENIENRPLDKETLKGAVEGLENYLNRRSLHMAAIPKGETVLDLYHLMILEEFRQKGHVDEDEIDKFLSAANNN